MKKSIRNSAIFFLTILFCYITEIGCIFHKITGLYCPGCGLTRCIKSLLNLDFYQAFRYNPLFIIFGILLIIYTIFIYFTKKQLFSVKYISNKTWYILVFITIIYGICRNISSFSWLAPTKIY